MSGEKIEAGDLVILKSGGPLMTVAELGVNDTVECYWSGENNNTCSATFQTVTLIKVK